MSMSADIGRSGRQFKFSEKLPYIESPKAEKPVVLKQLEIQVKVTGLFAETTQVMHFYNPNDRDFEGDFIFPLPPTGVVCGYGLDVQGTMVDGVIVPKQKARQVLETEIRKGADPGLVEQVQGNIYKTRIYPLPAKGQRIVKITYTNDLTLVGNEALYDLPLEHTQTADNILLRIEVQQSQQKPVISGGQGNVALTKWHQAWVAESSFTPGIDIEDLQIHLPDLPDTLKMIEKTEENDVFFCASQVFQSAEGGEDWQPKRVGLAWDASGSRTAIERDLNLLKAIFKKWQYCEVDIVVFRNKVEEDIKSFLIKQNGTNELIEYLRSLPYDGATNFSNLDLTGTASDVEAWLLFSDGLDTLQQKLPKIGLLPVYPVVHQASRNNSFLKYIAEKSGGLLLDIKRFDTEEVCQKLLSSKRRPWVKQSSGCEDLILNQQDRGVTVSGKLAGEIGSLTLALPGMDDVTLYFNSTDASDGGLLARQWAGQKIQEFTVIGQGDGEEALALAQRYGVVSSSTSLLVLESLDQYLEHNVEPPDSLPEMREQFHTLREAAAKEKTQEHKEQLERVVMLWHEKVEWWEKDYHADYERLRKLHKAKQALNDRQYFEEDGAESINNDVNHEDEFMAEPQESFGLASAPLATFEVDEMPLDGAEAGEEIEEEHPAGSTIKIQPWEPDQPYLKSIKNAEPCNQYSMYLRERTKYSSSPAFFMDCGDLFLAEHQHETGIRILSNLLEMQLEDVGLMRIYGWRLQQAGQLNESIIIFEQIMKNRDDEPQSFRDLALALGERWEKYGDEKDALNAMELLYRIVERSWPRFPEIELIVLMELNRLIHLTKQKGIATPANIDPRLRKLLDLDLRIVLSWDADQTDVDLHVFEPDGMHVYYGENLSLQGGKVSHDFTNGYGPEEYILRKAMPGKYKIKAHYFGSRQQTINGPCTVFVTVFTNYGRPNEKKQVLTLRLEESGSDFLVGEVDFGSSKMVRANAAEEKTSLKEDTETPQPSSKTED